MLNFAINMFLRWWIIPLKWYRPDYKTMLYWNPQFELLGQNHIEKLLGLSIAKNNVLLILSFLYFKLSCSVVSHWPCVEIYCETSFYHQFVGSQIKKCRGEVEKWKSSTLCKRNMPSANFAKKHFAVFDQTYIAVGYFAIKMMRWHTVEKSNICAIFRIMMIVSGFVFFLFLQTFWGCQVLTL